MSTPRFSDIRLGLSALLLIFWTPAPYADYVIRGEGKGHPFCEKIVATLNATHPTEKNYPCVSEVVLKMPGVSEPPWKKLDLAEHAELVKELDAVLSVGGIEYFARRSFNDGTDYWPKPVPAQQYLEIYRQLGAELFALWLPIYNPSAYGENVALLTLRYTHPRCGSAWQKRGEESGTAWVTADLKGIAKMSAETPLARRPLLYRGKLYFVKFNQDPSPQIFVAGRFGMNPVCTLMLSDKGPKQ